MLIFSRSPIIFSQQLSQIVDKNFLTVTPKEKIENQEKRKIIFKKIVKSFTYFMKYKMYVKNYIKIRR